MLVRYGAIVTQASGSLAGVTAANVKGASQLRARPRLTRQDSPAQLAQRQLYARAVAAWRALASGYKLQWTLYAQRNPRLNRLSVSRRLSPMQFYLKEALPRLAAGLNPPAPTPTKGQQGIGVPWEVSFNAGGPYTLAFQTPTADPHGYYIIGGTRCMSTTSRKKPYWHIFPGHYVEDNDSWDIEPDWTAVMGLMQTGELVTITIRYLGLYSLISAPASYDTVVT